MANVIVYDQDMKKVAYLENAFNIGYERPLNNLHRASFSLPAGDEKNAECLPLRFVEIFDNGERIDLFRIMPSAAQRRRSDATITYQCEHVLGSLLDDVLFQYHTVGNLGVYTADVINYVLQRQTTTRWQLGAVEFTRQFEYNWENENLLAALYSIPKPFDTEYMWTWDTSVYPWTLNLVEPPAGVQAYIRYGVNLQGITKQEDPTDLCTRIYPLGYGEGVNQLGIADLNGGLPYLDADTQAQYGVISKVWVDRRFTSAETLMARAQTMLDQLKVPRISYSVEASELYSLTRDPLDRFVTGAQVRVIDEEMGIDIIARVVNVRKTNVTGAPGAVTLEIANRPQNIAGSMADLESRQRINEVYAQGATNVNVYNMVDNADQSNPAKLRFWVPAEAVRINKLLLSYRNTNFRGYSRAIASAPAVSSGPSSITTTGPSSTETTEGGGGFSNWFSEVGAINFANPLLGEYSFIMGAGTHNHNGEVTNDGFHVHRIYDFKVNIPPHAHEMPHTHDMPHTHVIPSHTHGIEFGIYSGPQASSVTVKVDGNVVPGVTGSSANNIDLAAYLTKDDEGKIRRGQFHEIEISPNGLSRIEASVILQYFVQSRGGGNY